MERLYDGKTVRIPGFYDKVRPLTETEKRIVSEYPFSKEEFMESFGLKYLRYDNREDLIKALFGDPTFNVDGLISG